MEKGFINLFLGNPEITDYIEQYLEQKSDYVQARQRAVELSERLQASLSREQWALFLDYEAAQNRAGLLEVKGYYLFGLGLRRELLQSLDLS